MKVFTLFSLSLLVSLLGSAVRLDAQDRTVTGKVLDADELPVVGVAVIVEGTAIGAVSAEDGSFTLAAPSGDITLDVSSLGYVPQKVKLPAAKSMIVIYMEESNMLLDETVVVGYGTQKKVNLTGAVATVSSDKLVDRPSHSLTSMLQGSVAGLNVTNSSGVPGESSSLNIRGYTSINSASPLVLIDGAVGELSHVNPGDVESISVIKDAAASAVYGARAAFGVILVTTKSGSAKDGKATVRYSGRIGWEAPTTSTEYETRGYWSVYTINKFWKAESGANLVDYTEADMMQLLARVNDKTENPERPWVVEENGQWKYYGNYDWYHMLFRDRTPVQQHSVSLSGGNKDIKYFVSGAFDRQTGILRIIPDVFRKYNLRSKVDFRINKWATFSNNTSFYGSTYTFVGAEGNPENSLTYSTGAGLACFPMKNPDGSWLYKTPWMKYAVANGRHIILSEGKDVNYERRSDFSNTSELVITPVKTFKITANFTYRLHQNRDTNRKAPIYYRQTPGGPLEAYDTGAGTDWMSEKVNTWNYYTANVFANYDETFGNHHVSATAGMNYESEYKKNVRSEGYNLITDDLSDLNLVVEGEDGAKLTDVSGGQSEYALIGFFGRVNYDYKGKYLAEVSMRYDGTSRFAAGHRWGFFPSVSAGWRISEEPFFEPAKKVVSNLKLRASFGSLGNQNVGNYQFLRSINIADFKEYTFGESNSISKYATLEAPVAGDLTWEISQQYNVGIDMSMLDNRLDFTIEGYIRDTKNMLTDGVELPAVYGASVPKMNSADLRTSGYEISLNWRDQFTLAGKPFVYNIGGNVSDYKSIITKYDNPEKTFAKSYYEGMEIGEIWGFKTDGIFQTTEEAQAYAAQVNLDYINSRNTGGWQAGNVKFLDLDGDNILGIGGNSVYSPGDRVILGNSLASFQYGFNFGFDWYGFDFSAFFQGTGNHYWYPHGQNMAFWGCYSYPYLSYLPVDFLDKVWSEDNRDAYFPRPMAYAASGGPLSKVNDRYLQNIRYLRLKNLTVGYTIPAKLTRKIGIEVIRFYFSGENLAYWSPLKKNTKYVDPESAFNRDSGAYNQFPYPWRKTIMFGIDITF